jgi:dienelactone hydrolase
MSKYLARRSTEPTPIIAEVRAALDARPVPSLDVLICPCPVDTGGEGLDGFVDHFEDELLPELGVRPPAVACMGYSAGAAYAMHLAIVEEACAVVSIAGTGVLQAARHDQTILNALMRANKTAPAVALYRNAEDQTADLEDLVRNLPQPLRVTSAVRGTGGHAFTEYVRNGSVLAAFQFLLERLS